MPRLVLATNDVLHGALAFWQTRRAAHGHSTWRGVHWLLLGTDALGIRRHRFTLGLYGARYRNHGDGKAAKVRRKNNYADWHRTVGVGCTVVLYTRSNFST